MKYYLILGLLICSLSLGFADESLLSTREPVTIAVVHYSINKQPTLLDVANINEGLKSFAKNEGVHSSIMIVVVPYPTFVQVLFIQKNQTQNIDSTKRKEIINFVFQQLTEAKPASQP